MHQENKENNNKNAENKSNRLKLFFEKKKEEKKRPVLCERLRTDVCVCVRRQRMCVIHTAEHVGWTLQLKARRSETVQMDSLCSLCEGSSCWCWKPTECSGGAQPPTSKVSLPTFLMPLKVWDCGVCCFAANHRGIGPHASSFVFKAAVYVCVLW